MTKAIRIHETGGPEVLRWDDITVGRPGPGEVRLRHTAIGINFMDIYHRRGLYPLPSLPTVLGVEGAGLVEEVGPEVKDLAAGQRVAYISMPPGAYAQERLIPADHLVILPDGIEDQQAAAAISKGMTAEYLLRRTYPVQPNDFILVHAAAGGVGLMLCQWASHLGANVIGTVSSDEKADIARANGCGYPIVYTRENFAERVREITNGEGVAVVYDSVGNTTFEGFGGLPASPGSHGQLWRGVRAGSADRRHDVHGERIPILHPANPFHLHRRTRGQVGHGHGPVRRDPQRPRQRQHYTDLPARGRPACPPRIGNAADNRIDDSDP